MGVSFSEAAIDCHALLVDICVDSVSFRRN